MDSLKPQTTCFSWISAMRLRTLPLSVSGIIVGSCLAAYSGYFQWSICILALLTTVSLQVLSNLANDYGDGIKGTDNDDRVGPKRSIQSGAISLVAMRRGIRLNVVLTLVLALGLIFNAFGRRYFGLAFLFLLLGGIAIIAAIRYTIGKNSYGYRALGDIAVFLFFGLLSVIGSYVLYAKTFENVTLIPAVIIGLLSTAVLNLNNMRDIHSDKAAGKITIAVKLGVRLAKYYHYTLVLLAILLAIIFGLLYYNSFFYGVIFIFCMPLFFHIRRVQKIEHPKALDPELKIVAFSTFFLAIVLGVGLLIPA